MASYPIGGTIYDVTGTAIANATTTVIAVDVTQSTIDNRVQTSGTTDSTDGSYAIDLENLKDEYGTGSSVGFADGDKIQLLVYDADNRYYACQRHTVDVSAPPPTYNIYLHVGPPHLHTTRLLGGFASNSNSSATYFHIYDIEEDALIARIDILANTVVPLPLSIVGKEIKGGMCIVYTGDAANVYTNFVRSVK